MIRISASSFLLWCAILFGTFLHQSTAVAQNGRSTGRFARGGVITAITQGSISVTHDDGQQFDYSTNGLTVGPSGGIDVTGRLPMSFVEPGFVLSALVRMSPSGKAQGPVSTLTFVDDPEQELEVERTDTQGIYSVVGKVVRVTSRGVLLNVTKSSLAKRGRVELLTNDDTRLVFDMHTLDRVNAEDIVESMMGVTYESGINEIREIKIKLSPHRTRKVEALTKNDVLMQKYGYLSDDNTARPRDVKLKNFDLRTDISPLQAKILGTKLENMHKVVYRYFKKRPDDRIQCKIVANATNWVNETSSRATPRNSGMMSVDSGDNHNEVLRAAYEAFCKSTFNSNGPRWYCRGMSLMATSWELSDKRVSVAPEIVAYLKSNPPSSLNSVISDTGSFFSSAGRPENAWKDDAGCWALCYMMIHNANYANDFRSLGINMMSGDPETFELRFDTKMSEINFEFRQFLKNFDVGYREDLCQWQWKVTPSKLFGSDMVSTDVDARAGWQATKVELVAGQTYEYVAKGEWQTDPEFETSTASGLNGQGRLVGAIFEDYQLSETIRLGERGKFVAETDGQLYLRCDDKWNQIEDNKGRLKVYVRKVL